MNMIQLVEAFNLFLAVLFTVAYFYQLVYLVIGVIRRNHWTQSQDAKIHRYAAVISARNEAGVIAELIHSLKEQRYPQDCLDIYVVADNCTDNTADVVRSLGCHVVERHNLELVGKGYALTYLLGHMLDIGVADDYEAYFVFDADNKLDKHYFEEMNKAFCSGFKILTSYRNSVNLADNWVSSGSALWFIRESRFLSNSRMILGSSCHVGGTGFMFSREVMKRNKGWKFHLLTEDLEFTMDSILHGDRIGYCGTAILYDEQPVTFSQSWRQRLRWSKGFLQVFRYYGMALIKRAVRERDFSSVDFTLLLCPFTVLGVIRIVLGLLFVAFGFVTWQSQLSAIAGWAFDIVLAVVTMMALAALTIVAERDHIGATNKELFAYVLSFPIYMLSYMPISFQAIFSKAQWKPIVHKG